MLMESVPGTLVSEESGDTCDGGGEVCVRVGRPGVGAEESVTQDKCSQCSGNRREQGL